MINITTEIDNILKQELEAIAEDLKKKHIELGQKASGDWVNSIEVHVQGGRGVILGNDYTKYLTKGRSVGKQPPIKPLEKWVNNKLGITGKDARSVAFAVAFKIGDKGTKIYQEKGSDLIDGVITEKRINKIKEKLRDVVLVEINEDLKRTLIL